MELSALGRAYPEMKALGAEMVAISPTLQKFAAEVREKHHLTFDVLSDLRNEVARRFGIVFEVPDDVIEIYRTFPLNIPDYNGDDSWTLPIPARFVISRDGVIRKVDADPDYTRRPEPQDTIEFLKTLR
ncbi:MAG: redoxin domain-containing protein [Vulcanimicrobiaceae bacterium]